MSIVLTIPKIPQTVLVKNVNYTLFTHNCVFVCESSCACVCAPRSVVVIVAVVAVRGLFFFVVGGYGVKLLHSRCWTRVVCMFESRLTYEWMTKTTAMRAGGQNNTSETG